MDPEPWGGGDGPKTALSGNSIQGDTQISNAHCRINCTGETSQVSELGAHDAGLEHACHTDIL